MLEQVLQILAERFFANEEWDHFGSEVKDLHSELGCG